nr:Panacea domain-containing protein [uncultured Dyadobacter sp.]
MLHPYSDSEIDKLGNAVIYLADQIQPLSKTKLLKLIYLIEEYSVRTYGLPFFNLNFSVWKLGPVSRDVFVDLSSDEPVLLARYISKSVDTEGATYIHAQRPFADDEFSDNEIELLEHIAETFQSTTAAELIDLTHRKHSLWHIIATENGVLEYLEAGYLNSTEIPIDFSRLLEDMPLKKELYLDQLNYLRNVKALKA